MYLFITSEVDGGAWLASRLSRFTLVEAALNSMHIIQGFRGSRAGLDVTMKMKVHASPLAMQTPSFSPLY
jgi:hypothetical protein